jgi:hypothetical protein
MIPFKKHPSVVNLLVFHGFVLLLSESIAMREQGCPCAHGRQFSNLVVALHTRKKHSASVRGPDHLIRCYPSSQVTLTSRKPLMMSSP